MFNKWLKRVSISYLFIRHVVRAKQQQKLSESFPRKYFSPFLGPSNENAENLLPEVTFDHFWGQSWNMLTNRLPEGTFDHIWCQAAKMLKINCRRPLLTISEAKQQQCSKSITGVYIGPYLETCYQVLEKWYQVRATRYYIRYTIYYIPYTIYHVLYTLYYILYTILYTRLH